MGADLYRVVFELYGAPYYYWCIIAVPVICLFRDVTWKFVLRTDLPESYHIVQELEKIRDRRGSSAAGGKGHKIYTGYSFAQDPGEAEHVRQQYSSTNTTSSV